MEAMLPKKTVYTRFVAVDTRSLNLVRGEMNDRLNLPKKAEEILGKKANLNKMTKAERAKWANKARARRSKGQKEEISEKEIDFEPTLLVIIEEPKKEEEEVDDVNEKKEFKPSLLVVIEDPEGEDLNTMDESSFDAGLINDDFDSLEQDGSDGEIFASPTEQSDKAATNDIPSDGMGSGWTESGKRYSRRLQLKLSPDKKDPSTEALGSGMTEKGRRYSRRVVNRKVPNKAHSCYGLERDEV
ncbi:unnamed protein product [Cylindrotheca closterium]|uniref:Uncharacterized protein n=1 Tax=Cylindrotheca closterium TaxID=2856 RepID=A0AAD2FBU8_9STRA|nr:unnamed protein product [Cylindrotheca closterium]